MLQPVPYKVQLVLGPGTPLPLEVWICLTLAFGGIYNKKEVPLPFI